jgi:hypothetical protein
VEGRSRILWIVLTVLVAVAVPLVVLALASGGGEESDEPDTASIKVERARGLPEIVVYVEDPDLNVPETARGRKRVTVECLNTADAVIYGRGYAWPFTDTDNGLLDPHVHLEMAPGQLDRVSRCRVTGTRPRLEGRLL